MEDPAIERAYKRSFDRRVFDDMNWTTRTSILYYIHIVSSSQIDQKKVTTISGIISASNFDRDRGEHFKGETCLSMKFKLASTAKKSFVTSPFGQEGLLENRTCPPPMLSYSFLSACISHKFPLLSKSKRLGKTASSRAVLNLGL